MSKLPNFWQFFNLTSQPTIPSLYWDAYSYEERIKKICDKIWAILNYLKLVMELMNEFDDRLTVLEELYNALEARVERLERLYNELKARVDQHDIQIQDLIERVTEIERQLAELDIDGLLRKVAELEQKVNTFDARITKNTNDITKLKTDLQSLTTSVNEIKADLVTIKSDIAKALFRDRFSLKIADPDNNTSLNKVINKNKLMVFKNNANATYSADTHEWNMSDPFVIDSADIEVGTWSEVIGNNISINAVNVQKNAIVLDDGATRYITDNNHTYYLMLMICTVDGYTAYFKDNSDKELVTFTKKVDDNIWVREISKYIEASDEATAKQNSTNDPNKIYYVVETDSTT